MSDVRACNRIPLNEFHVTIQVLNNGGATVNPVAAIEIAHAIDFLDHWPVDMAADGTIYALFTGVVDDGVFLS